MIPSILAHHVEQGIKDFLRTTFPVATPFFSNILENFILKHENVFKGPYLDIQLPFQQGKGGPGYFPNLPMSFPPYLHQEIAFDRLAGTTSKSTIIATGTGSGKTECFLYPILDHCYRHKGEHGIKAIIIYPMNALATDQAGRLAKLIHNSSLRGHVTAGLYVGQREKHPSTAMSEDRLITDKGTIRLNPPDILLTNYKMLDYLLIRPDDRPLWDHNNSETLRYLVVDELHTFDGAQGSDLGCLLRRLKARLLIEPDFLCCIGTSATLGSEDQQDELIEYTSQVFGQNFNSDSVITESRLSAAEFLGDSLISHVNIVSITETDKLAPAQYSRYEDFIISQHALWFNKEIEGSFQDQEWRIQLGKKLKEHLFFQNLLKILGGKVQNLDYIISKLSKVTQGFDKENSRFELEPESRREVSDPAILILNSLITLISEARIRVTSMNDDGTEKIVIRPFLNVRVQLWIRELRRMVASVSKEPELRFADDLNQDQLNLHLPLVHCRECGSMGWTGLKRKNSTEIIGELKNYYRCFFSHNPKVVYLFPEKEKMHELSNNQQGGNASSPPKPGHYYFCTQCLHVNSKENPECCPVCDHDELLIVYMPDVRFKIGDRQYSHNNCPYCDAYNSLTLLGSRAASLTSVMIVQLFSSSFNDDKKLLTFSDNVQDAAHRAGFFNGRTYRFNFRIALQRVVLNNSKGVRLSDLPDLFVDHWTQKLGQNRFISTFLAPNMEWLSDYDNLKEHGSLPEDSNLMKNINKRILWEIISGYGFQARIGRTLEKTGSSIAYVNPEIFEKCSKQLLETLRNEIGIFRTLDMESLNRFLIGFIIHLKNQGGIFLHELSTYISSYGPSFLLNREIWMPNFGQYSRTPSYLTTKKGSRFDQLISSASTHRTWYQSWAEKCFLSITPMVLAVSSELYNLVLKTLSREGLFREIHVKGDSVWGIQPVSLLVSSDVQQFRCNSCGHNISCAKEESMFLENSHCQRFHCIGRYQPLQKESDYYGKLYATGDVERIFAKEHTGLLEREERENLEIEFKAEEEERKPWFPNLLSCTPTLEMGIDIGDLSSLVLCSVPPAQANYLQRIGRAGRRDGNALNLTVANARPHDLFFFSEPEEMLTGLIDTPGIFLDASAVLERQFTAFCFDRWIAGDSRASVPLRLGQVLSNLKVADRNKFPFSLIYFIETNQADLFDQFIEIFRKSESPLSPESEHNLKIFVEGDEQANLFLRGRILNDLHAKRRERESLRQKARTINSKIKKKQKQPKDKNFKKELRDLQIEKSALQTLVKSISDRNTFNFFTDQGLLPNYAFPEVGVMLNSLIYRKKTKIQEGEGSYDTWRYEYERPAASAISELAPANTFYAEGRRVKVDQVDLTVSEIENWRFCDNCSHKELIIKENERDVCIHCGSPIWRDAGQKRQMIRMRQVFASTSDKKSRISDDSDDRDPVFYNKQMLVEFDDNKILDAFKVDADFPFGFDFLSGVDFCEINFGEKTEIGEKVTISGLEIPRKGFSICRSCGKVQDDRKKEPAHALTCSTKDKESDKQFLDCIYLYRQFVSEAIRILLPVSIISDSDKKLHSFIAGLHLGLKKKFKGKIDHLQTTVHEEPLPASSLKRKYLVLYDTIPGGTGYLKQLMQSEQQLMEVFSLALESLKSCVCNQDQSKDGCYRCLFAYRNSYNMPQTSRDTAIELFSEILSYTDRLIKTENIRNISMNSLIESELEARFISALKLFRSAALPVLVKNDIVNGKPGYFLKVADRHYYIEPQVSLGELNGVSIESRADFVIKPARQNDNMKPIAIFLDGFTYHRDRIGLDMAQRMAIVQSEKYHVWSLSWYDIESKFKSKKDFYINFLDPGSLPAGGNLNQLLTGYGLTRYRKLIEKNSFDLLIRFLTRPEADKWRKYMFVISMLYLDSQNFGENTYIKDWVESVDSLFPENIAESMKDTRKSCLYGEIQHNNMVVQNSIRQFVALEKDALKPPGDSCGVRFGCCLQDHEIDKDGGEFSRDWNSFLRLYNFFQFLPFSYFVTTDGVKTEIYDNLKLMDEDKSFETQRSAKPGIDLWKEVKELTDKKYHSLLDFLRNHDWPVPEAGYELQGPENEIVGSAELAWDSLKLALFTDDELAYQSNFIKAGWKIFQITDVVFKPEIIIEMKTNRGE